MKKTLLSCIAATALLVSCNNAGTNDKAANGDSVTTMTSTTETNKDDAFVPVDSATAAKAWMANMTPGEPHKELAKSNGKWTAETSMWMEEGAPPTISTGTMTNKMIMGGRFQMGEFKGTMMGGPFEGMSLVGYDNAKKKFVSNWIDNMGTGVLTMEGTWDNATKSINLTGSMTDPATGKACNMKEVFTMVDDDHQTMEMWGPNPKTGEPFKTMEIKFTRVK